MRTKVLLFVSVLFATIAALGQGTAFTYQGRLDDGGNPAHGVFDFRFKLYEDPDGNNQAGSTLLTNGLPLTDGLFTVTLDFDGLFNGSNYWLEVDVRTNGGSGYVNLNPLQPILPTPYAIFANTASNLSGTISSLNLSGTYGSAVVLNNGANSFGGSFTGNGANVTNVNAATLSGLGASSFWATSGNAGTSPANGNFLGTTDFQPLELKAGGMRVLRLEPDGRTNTDGLSGNLIGGFTNNLIEQPGSGADFIGSGGYSGGPNIIHSNSAGVFIGAGSANQIGPNVNDAVIAGGYGNTIGPDGDRSVIGGGLDNTNDEVASVIGGGWDNTVQAYADYAFIGGGYGNVIQSNATYCVIAGGNFNTISNAASVSTVGGGGYNAIQAGAYDTTIAGGISGIIGSPFDTIGGGGYNTIGTNSNSGTIGGGYANRINDNTYDSAIGGGSFHSIGMNSYYSTIAGGRENMVGDNSTGGNGGGVDNTNMGVEAVISGGNLNIVTNDYAAIGGGFGNTAGGSGAVVPGGSNNRAVGDNSFAAGSNAHANGAGAFVWGDNSGSITTATANNEFVARASGGVFFFSGTGNVGVGLAAGSGTWASLSDRDAKDDFAPVDPQNALARVAALPITVWSYKTEPAVRHIGPMAQDFHAAFKVGEDDRHITEVDEGGAALAAIQGLNQKLHEKDVEIQQLQQSVAELKQLVLQLAKDKTSAGNSGRN